MYSKNSEIFNSEIFHLKNRNRNISNFTPDYNDAKQSDIHLKTCLWGKVINDKSLLRRPARCTCSKKLFDNVQQIFMIHS